MIRYLYNMITFLKKGDSGGPQIIANPKNSDQIVQIGLVSFGSPECNG